MTIRPLFWLRWTWRDLRHRWLQVIAVGIIIAFGAGIYAGLAGQEGWRVDSYDESYAMLDMYDLRMEFADGSFVDYAELQSLLADIEGIAAYEGRLQIPTLVDASEASTTDDTVLMGGQIIGVDVSDAGPHVNRFYIRDDEALDTGRLLTEADNGQYVALIDLKFARQFGIDSGSSIKVSGDVTLQVVGLSLTPEYFLIINPESNNLLSYGSFAPVFVPLETAQLISDREGLVNDAVLLLEPDADADAVTQSIEDAMAQAFPGTGFRMSDKDDNVIRQSLYDDAEGDQVTWNLVAIIFLIGASFGVFNLASRMVQSQRRQIGIGMALGVPRLWIALRPMLVGLEIAILGTIFGLLMGYGIKGVFAAFIDDFVPMPIFEAKFYLQGFLIGAALGIILPLLATLIPVWRAVRVPPIEAITTGHLVAKGGGLGRWLNRVPIPGDSFVQMPLRNIFRAPGRTMLTALGISMAIILMIVFVGFLDTFNETIERGKDSLLYEGESRVVVGLDFFYPVDLATARLAELDDGNGNQMLQQTVPQLSLGGSIQNPNGDNIDVLIEMLPMDNTIWVPRLLDGVLPDGNIMNEIVISAKTADDLGLDVGDSLMLEHPQREGQFAFRLVTSEFEVVGIHDNPIANMAYMDFSDAELMGLQDSANTLLLVPTDGMDVDELKQILFRQPGVTSVEAVSQISDGFDEILELFTQILVVVAIIVVVMSFLIAFNTTTINVDERVREIATMFAFGLPIRTVTRMQMVENFLLGVLSTVVGIVLGWLVLYALVATVEDQLESLKLFIDISPGTMLLAALLGIITVTLTPLLSIRRMRRMDIPSELRVME